MSCPGESIPSTERDEVNSAAVERTKAAALIEVMGGEVANVDGQLEPGNVGPGQLDGMGKDGTSQAPAARGGGQAQVRDFPGVALGGFRKQEHGARVGLAPNVPDPPTLGHEPARRAMA